MRLWTIQTMAAWEALQQQGVLRGEKRFLWSGDDPGDEVLRAYDWLCEQMERRVGSRPLPETYPVWAWAQWKGRRQPRPDLRAREYCQLAPRGFAWSLSFLRSKFCFPILICGTTRSTTGTFLKTMKTISNLSSVVQKKGWTFTR
jgi:hypothetical protein